MLPGSNATHVTEEEFLALPESHEHVELLDGEIIVTPSPTWDHQSIVLELSFRFRAWTAEHPPAAVGLSPMDVRFAKGRILQPDLFVLAGPAVRGRPGPVLEIPELVVEVMSHHRAYDRLLKRGIYADSGVPEYWIVDPVDRQIEQVVGLETVAVVRDGDLTSRRLQGLVIDVPSLFPG